MERRAYGGDHLSIGRDGSFRLSCPRVKEGWTPRRAADHVRRDFPGTCIRWDDEYFEVVGVQRRESGVAYLLRPWDDAHTMRSVLDYDEASEIRREEERRQEQSRRVKAAGFNVGAIVTGLLPAAVQDDVAIETGISASRVTLISCVIPFAIGFLSLLTYLASALGGAMSGSPSSSSFVFLPGVYFFVESLIRASVAMAQDRPIGSLPVVLVWEMIAAMTGKRPLRQPEPKLKWELDAATLDRDAFIQREPFLALLSPGEQKTLEQKYGFDWAARGRKSATVLLVFALLVLAVTLPDLFGGRAGAGDLVTIVFMAYLIWEQVVRFQRIGAGEPAGSVLGVFIRPISRKLFV